MVRSNIIAQISSNTTLSELFDIYMVNGGIAPIDFNITLPLITSDGMNYQLIREDTLSSRLITISSSGGNSLFINLGTGGTTSSGTTGTILLLPQTAMDVKSFGGDWYITRNVSLQRVGAKTLFSSAFVSNGGGPVTMPSGNGTICLFPYVGGNVEQITSLSIITKNGTTVTLTLIDQATGLNMTTLKIPPNATSTSSNTTTITNIPTIPSIIAVNYSGAGNGANALNVYSLIIG